jgi:PIN domain nuclease of toxin-antitoxin system
MSGLVADTHAVVWYFFGSSRLSAYALATIEAAILAGGPVFVATVSLVEVVYLIEKGRIPAETFGRLTQKQTDPTRRFVPIALDPHVADALRGVPRADVPDVPDRIIVATARHLNCPLVTADQRIQAAGIVTTVW